jgi:Mu-like prophage major head subunit gpT
MQEALSTSDFPILFADILDREMLQQYQQLPAVWRDFATTTTVRDFRPKKFFDLLGGRAILDPVGELAEYPARDVTDAKYQLSVGKYGGRFALSWEAIVNDDLDQLRDLPNRLAQGSRDTESYYATAAVASATGPNAGLFGATKLPAGTTGKGSAASSNVLTGNPALTTQSLSDALTTISTRRDSEGRPIYVQGYILMVPPALEVAANNIINASEIRDVTGNRTVILTNWLAGRVRVVVNPWLPYLDVSANVNTTWYLLPAPANGRPAVVVGFLRGHETPDLRVKASTGQSIGGGALAPTDGSFEVDDIQYRARHILGTTSLDPLTTAASNGSGTP